MEGRKNIAVLIDWYLPGNKAGGPVRSVYSLLNLLKEEFNFFVITTNCDLGSTDPYPSVEPDKWIECNGIPVYYFSKAKLKAKKLQEVLNEINADIVYLNSFWSYYFSLLPLRLKRKGKIRSKIILAPRGMLGKGALTIKPLKKKLVLSIIKLIGLHSGVTFHATTSDEESEIRGILSNAKVKVAPNVNATALKTERKIFKHPGELRLFYLSRISRVKNLHYALEILSSVNTGGSVTYDIYGSMEDEDYWKQCKEIIKIIPENISVTYKGELSFEMVQPAIENYHFLFLPTLNENFGHSIYESLVSACPVIISDTTPWNEVNKAGCGYAIPLKEKKQFVNVISGMILADNQAYSSIWKNCIKFMSDKVDQETHLNAYLNLFQ